MDLFAFITHADPTTLGQVFCFITKQDSLLVSSLFKKKFELATNQPVVLASYDSFASIKAQLEMSFLGQTAVFWITHDLIADDVNFQQYLSTYKGPHCIGYRSEQIPGSHKHEVTLNVSDEINYEQFMAYLAVLYPSTWNKAVRCAQQVFKHVAMIPIQSVLPLMQYCMLIGANSDVFLEEWLPTLLNPEKSLFTLSSLLFAKKEQQFFALWSLLAHDYSEPFWTTYWSEQFFRATLFISLMHAQKAVQAKKIAYRLPFSFVQKDWKTMSVDSLKKAHDHLYTLDWNIKNGLSAHFDYFYAHFFMQKP